MFFQNQSWPQGRNERPRPFGGGGLFGGQHQFRTQNHFQPQQQAPVEQQPPGQQLQQTFTDPSPNVHVGWPGAGGMSSGLGGFFSQLQNSPQVSNLFDQLPEGGRLGGFFGAMRNRGPQPSTPQSFY